MAFLLSEAIKLVIVSSIALGVSFVLMVGAHELHDDQAGPIALAMDAAANIASNLAAHDLAHNDTIGVAESLHGHSHDGFSHDHAADFLSEKTVQFDSAALTTAPDDWLSSVYPLPVFEIDIPPQP